MIQKTKRPISILLVLLMIVGMFSVLPISAGATDYVEGSVLLDDLAAGDTLSASSGDYLRLRGMDSSVIIKGGTYIGMEDSEARADDTEFQAEQIVDMMIRNVGGDPVLTVMTDEDYKEYYPINAEGNNLSDKWYVLSNENDTVTLGGHVPAAVPDTWTFKLNSNFSGQWNADTDVVSEQPIELTLAEGDYEFQIVAYKNGTLSSYRGNVEAGSSTDTYSQVMHDRGGNAKFHANGGKYELTYNAGTGVAAITKTVAGLSTWADVKAAAANGGSYVLLNDIYYCESADDLFDFAPAAVANDLSIDGNGYAFKAKNTTWGGYYEALFKVNAGKKLSLSNMNYNGTDGYNGSDLVGAVFDALVVAADGANVSLTDVTTTALRGENAVVLNGASTADITRCAFNNTYLDGDDIKIDSAASVTLDGTTATVGTVDGYKVVENNGTYTAVAKTYVAEVVSGNNVGTKYETVNDAVAAAGENGEVKLIADINIAAGELNVGIDGDYTTTLDLNGHTITNAAGSGITLYSNYPGGKTFTIKDSSPEQTGAITITKKYPGDGCISDSSGRKVVIEGGTYTSNANALYVSSDNGWTINGGTFNGNIKVVSKLDVTDGTINGAINATGPSWTEAPAEVTISGGTVNGSLNSENESTYEVSGGTFSEPVPADYCANGYSPVTTADEHGMYTVEKTKAVEAYNANGDLVGAYTTIDAAIEAGGDGCTVKLVADLYEQQQINSQKTPVTLDLNGHMIDVQNGAGLNFSMGYYWNGDHIFTIKDTSEEHTGGINITPKYFGNACISDNIGRTIIVEGGTFTSTGKAIYCTGSDDGITVNGGTFNGDIYVHDTGYGHGALSITGGTVNGTLSTVDNAVLTVSGGTFSEPVPADFCAEGYDPKDNGDGTYTVTPHVHDWDYENVSWTFIENPTTHSIYAKYTLTCKTDPTHTKEPTGSGTSMVTVAVDGDKFVYSHSAVKIDGNSVAVPNYTRNIADGIINQLELKAAAKVAGEYKLANDITGFYNTVKPVDGFVLDGQNHMIKYGTMNASGYVMFVAADQNTKFTLKNITLDGYNRAKWAVCAYTDNGGNNAGNVITLEKVTIQNFKSKDYVGAINAFGSSTWNLKDCTITGNITADDSDGLSGSAVWAGSKATINIDGGTYDEVYLHSYSGTGAVLNADGGATINNLVLDLNKTDTLKANIDKATVGAITSNEGTIPEEAVVMDPTKATVAAPAGYKWVDSDETGMKTLAKIVDLFTGNGLALHGDIGVIFYLNPEAAGFSLDQVNSVSVDFACDQYSGTVTDFTKDATTGYIKVAYYVPVAYMASDIIASNVKINNIPAIGTDTYTVQKYALDTINDPDAPAERKTLMKEMLNYGAKAKAVFESQMANPDEAVYEEIPDYTKTTVTAEMIGAAIEGEATDMSTVKPEEGAQFYGSSVIYLSETTLRMVFAIPDGSGSKLPENAYTGHQGKWYHWVDQKNIPAAELHKRQHFTVGNATFNYSALDYAKAVLNSNMDQKNKDLVSAMYLYNRAAVDALLD